jgi:hypothetical protein
MRKAIVDMIIKEIFYQDEENILRCKVTIINKLINTAIRNIIDKETAIAEAYYLLYKLLLKFKFKNCNEIQLLQYFISPDNWNNTSSKYTTQKKMLYSYYKMELKKLNNNFFYESLEGDYR